MRISDWSSDVCSSDLQAGSGTLVGARLLLESFGLAESAIEVAYLKSDDAMERLVAGKLDAFFLIAGYPAKEVQWAGEQTAISLVPITGEPTAVLVRLNPFLLHDSISALFYTGVCELETTPDAAICFARQLNGPATFHRLLSALWS